MYANDFIHQLAMLMLLDTVVLPCSLAVSELSQDKFRHECGLSRSSLGDKACISMKCAHFHE